MIKKFSRLLSLILVFAIFCTQPVFARDNQIIDRGYGNKIGTRDGVDIYYNSTTKIYYLITNGDTDQETIDDIVRKLKQDKVPIVEIIEVVYMLVDLGIKAYEFIAKSAKEKAQFEAIRNGWAKIDADNRAYWFFKKNGVPVEGWHWDSTYQGWYYFQKGGVMFDPRYIDDTWARINNKWYEFEPGGKLIEHVGWRQYKGKWLFHLPNDCGAIAGSKALIDGKWYSFDEYGYWME